MDSAAMYAIIGSFGGGCFLVAGVAIARNEYIYRMNKPPEERGPLCFCCPRWLWWAVYRVLDCIFGSRAKVRPARKENKNIVPPTDPPFKEGVDCMFVVKRLKNDGIIDEAQCKLLSEFVASRDPRLVGLVRKYSRNMTENTVLTRNTAFHSALVLLARNPPPDPRILEAARLKAALDAEAEAKQKAAAEAQRRWRAAFLATKTAKPPPEDDGSSDEEVGNGGFSWLHT